MRDVLREIIPGDEFRARGLASARQRHGREVYTDPLAAFCLQELKGKQ
jgi:hypothetical protein